jgi:hypothetical protein
MRRALILAPCVLNLIACAVFLIVRPPMTELLEERDAALRNGSISVNSADPFMFIAERPLREWNEWHGGEARWVKVIEVLNAPSLAAMRALGDRWSRFARARDIGSLRGDSWVMAWTYLVLSSVQWLLIGAVIARLTRSNNPGR